ncbi:PepSY domain-containing protein [Mogibacterium pumilum]|uniref:PepSY domain-containing protein n=1 Tax=Mogibacterium pumilum TaxID=86332 RepID=A0A223ARC4_9FIRM|nr:PepSY domain-containing protein [Mogibacterium pumilum]ASS37496.1 hypothetical protein AXF17_02825 [Mogibacterium pumilum]
MNKTIKMKTAAKIIALTLFVTALGAAVACANNSSSNTSSGTNADTKTKLTVEKAKEIALKESNSGKVTGYEKDVDFGRTVFEITILDGQTEKEYKVDANSGKLLKVEAKELSADPEEKMLINANPQNDLDKAESLVKAKYPKAIIKKVKLEVEDNTLVYEATVIEGDKKIEVKFDANTGSFIEEDVEGHDD